MLFENSKYKTRQTIVQKQIVLLQTRDKNFHFMPKTQARLITKN